MSSEAVYKAGDTGTVKVGRNTITVRIVAKDAGAFGGEFVWAPCKPGERGGGNGTASWQVQVETAGTYHLWGRVSTGTPPGLTSPRPPRARPPSSRPPSPSSANPRRR